MAGRDELERALLAQIKMAGLPIPTREYKAIPNRRFRWDMAWIEPRILLEVQGAIWVKGGHSTGRGITRDCEKLNLASMAGWHCFAVTSDMIKDGTALRLVQEATTTFPPF
jgi:hypothetical protein